MANYLILLAITFGVVALAGILINYSKRRVSNTNHGLTGMCHRSGGPMCCSCAGKMTGAAAGKPALDKRKHC